MFEKMKQFYKKHEVVILTIGGGIVIVTAGVLLGKKIKSNNLPKIIEKNLEYDDSANRALLESYGAVFKNGRAFPFATKEIAIKFLEDRGDTYQIDILDDSTSIIWISK